MISHWVGESKMKPIGVDDFFQRKASNNETYSTLNSNEPTDKLVVIENITEESSENPDNLYEEAIVNLEEATKIIGSMTKLKNLLMLNTLLKKHIKFLRIYMQKQLLILKRMLFLKILINVPTTHLCILI